MFYREVGQFKTSYDADEAIFPIAQDRWSVIVLIAFASLGVPLFAGQYLYTEVLIPVLILSIAAIGLNILTGYCGQLSLGSGGFMAVGAYAAYNLALRLPETNIILVFLFAGVMAMLVGLLFGLPSLRIKGFYLAVATLASQFFLATALWIGPVFALRETLVNRVFTVFSIGAGCPDGAAPPARSRAGAETSGDHRKHLLGAEHAVGLDAVGTGTSVKEKTAVIEAVTPRSAAAVIRVVGGRAVFHWLSLPAECGQAEAPSRTRQEGFL